MSPRDLITSPCWRGVDLGHPLPDHPHAVSVALPRWQDVIAYEEQETSCRQALRTVYPRFGQHPLVAELSQRIAPVGGSAWPFPTDAAARAAEQHCRRQAAGAITERVAFAGLTVLSCDAAASPHAKAFWQHTGLGATSRQAAIALGRDAAPSQDAAMEARTLIRERLAAIHRCDPALISLHPSGMSGLNAALRAIDVLAPARPTLQLGFPYVDVLKQPQVIFHGGELLQTTDLNRISAALDQLNPGAVIVELPSNPLLRCVDLPAIAQLAHQRGIPLIADDTIGTAINLSVLPHVDLLFTSLTKSFAGSGDVMAGSLLISPDSPWHQRLREALQPLADLSDADAIALEQASRDVRQRVPQLDANCLTLAERLEQHPAIRTVMHPKDCTNFQSLMRPGAGFGCLLSFEVRGGDAEAKQVYDNLQISKGPSLGTSFSLACPYTLLAHYDELAWAADCGVPAHLLRVSVGLENPDDLWQRFVSALEP